MITFAMKDDRLLAAAVFLIAAAALVLVFLR